MNLAIPNEIKQNLKEEVSVQDKISKWENTKEKKQVIEAFTKLFTKKPKIPETQTQSIQLRNNVSENRGKNTTFHFFRSGFFFKS